jgi:hypothetical protein
VTRAALAGLIVVTLGGCFPYPHLAQHLPGVEGRVVEREGPAPGVKVSLRFRRPGEAEPCATAAEATSVTDSDGGFTMPGERRLDLLIGLGHSFESWGFCFTRPEGSAVSWSTPSRYRAGPRYGPVRMTLDCDLGRKAADVCWIRAYEYGKW